MTGTTKAKDAEVQEEEVKPKVYTDQYVVWDQEGGVVLAGPFVEKESAEDAKVAALSKSHQWEESHLTIEKLPH